MGKILTMDQLTKRGFSLADERSFGASLYSLP